MLHDQIGAASHETGVPPKMLAAVMKAESDFNPQAKSKSGATGLMQFMPATAQGFGIDPSDPAASIHAAAKYLASLYKKFGTPELALAAYNAGPGNVQKYGGIPPFPETRAYVTKIMGWYNAP